MTSRAILFPILIPLGTDAPRHRPAFAAYAISALIVAMFAAALAAPDAVFRRFALHPGEGIWQYATYMFVHIPVTSGPHDVFAALLHMLINLYFFFIFGPGLENRIGARRLLGFFLAGGIAAGIAHAMFYRGSASALTGASGAVFAVIGAYMMLFPFTKVRTVFCIVLAVVPIWIRRPAIPALFFLPVFWVLQLAVEVILTFFVETRDSMVSTSAHVGGLWAGMGLAAAFYGVRAFSVEAERERTAELRVQQRISEALRSVPLTQDAPPPAPVAFAPIDARPAPDVAEPMRPLHRLVVSGMDVQARNLYAEMLKQDPDACLDPGAQMDLARMIERLGDRALALRAFEVFLKHHPQDEATPPARFELARLLVLEGRDLEWAASLLRSFIDSGPALDFEREAQAIYTKLPESARNPVAPPVPQGFAGFEPDPLALPPEAPKEPASEMAARLFGDPEDTGNQFGASGSGLEPPRSRTIAPPANAGAPIDPDDGIRLDDSGWLREHGFNASKPDFQPEGPLAPPAWSGHPLGDQPAVPVAGLVVPQSAGIEARPGQAFEWRPKETAPQIRIVPHPFVPLPELAPARDVPLAPDQTSPVAYASAIVSSEKNRQRALDLRGETAAEPAADGEAGRCALILAPGAKVDIDVVIAALAPVMGLNPEGAHHAILRRRGILAEGLKPDEARELALRMAHSGQSVALAAEGRRAEFAPPLDLLQIKPDESGARFGHEQGAVHRRWDEAVLLGGGWVGTQSGGPCRAAADIFFREPNLHLRIWENTFGFEPAPRGDRRERYRDLVRWLLARTGAAIQTRTLNAWVEEADPHAEAGFTNAIEYENFLRWHLLAYCVPSQRFDPRV